ncbi:MAG: hypothetical protein AAF488_17730, partial [Planctomycetota bacterium]
MKLRRNHILWAIFATGALLFSTGLFVSASLAAAENDKKPKATEGNKADSKPEAVDTPPVIQLIEAGANPRSALRYQLTKKDRQVAALTLGQKIEVKMNGNVMPEQKIPKQKVVVDVQIQDVKPAGATYAFEFVELGLADTTGVPPRIAQAFDMQLKKIVGAEGKATVNPQGVTRDSSLVLPNETDPNLLQMVAGVTDLLKRVGTALPKEDVGIGAKWKVTRKLKSSGIALSLTENY